MTQLYFLLSLLNFQVFLDSSIYLDLSTVFDEERGGLDRLRWVFKTVTWHCCQKESVIALNVDSRAVFRGGSGKRILALLDHHLSCANDVGQKENIVLANLE
jgi:hypothetical protein